MSVKIFDKIRLWYYIYYMCAVQNQLELFNMQEMGGGFPSGRRTKPRLFNQKEYAKQWKLKNPEYFQKYGKERRQNDINFKIACNLRSRLNKVIKNQNAKKINHTIELIGCSIEFLRHYLEKQFKEGMTWANYGRNGWSIDHIRPCASFDLTDPEQQKICFNYKNLQPLWTIDNIKKGAKSVARNI